MSNASPLTKVTQTLEEINEFTGGFTSIFHLGCSISKVFTLQMVVRASKIVLIDTNLYKFALIQEITQKVPFER